MMSRLGGLGKVQTIGYSEPGAAGRIEAFLDQPRTGLVDIRYSPRCGWDAQWNKNALLAKYGNTKYIHLRCFGNVNYNKPGQPIQLANPEERLSSLVNFLLNGGSLMLLCACKNYERCHRKVVYELIKQEVKRRLAAQRGEVHL